MTEEESSSQQQLQTVENFSGSTKVKQLKSTVMVGLAPGTSIDWKSNTFVGSGGGGGGSDTTTSKTSFATTTNTSPSTQGSSSLLSSSSTSTVAMTEPQTETNINGLTGNLKQMTLSPKTVSKFQYFEKI